jgi:single-stranded DNA-binding protein
MTSAVATIVGRISKMEESYVGDTFLLKISVPTYARNGADKHATWWQACLWAKRGLAANRVLQVGDLVSLSGNIKVVLLSSEERKPYSTEVEERKSYQAEIECLTWARLGGD